MATDILRGKDNIDDPKSKNGYHHKAPPLQGPTLQRSRTSDLLQIHINKASAESARKKTKENTLPRGNTQQFQMASSFAKLSVAIGVQPEEVEGLEQDEEDEEEEEEEEEDDRPPEERTGYDSSDYYDTDLDCEEREDTPYDTIGKRTYGRSCRKMKINPVGAVHQGLKGNAIEVKGRGMDHCDSLAICASLLENTTVSTLILDDNKLGWKGCGYIALMLCENSCINTLSLVNNDMGSKGCQAIMEMLTENDSLHSLNIAGNNLTDSDVKFIAKIMKDNRNITYLNLSHNDISDIGVKHLQPAIADNECLRTLDLSWNKIRPAGGVAICEGLSENVVLSTISLAYNGLSIAGAKAMGECLQLNEILTDLDLTSNRMFDEGVAHIARALFANETLKKLRISNNAMTTASAITVLSTIKENPDSALDLLDMANLHIYREALGLVEQIKFINNSFQFICGGIVNSDDNIGGNKTLLNQNHPMKILREFMVANNLRISDLFKQLDRDGSGTVSRDEFIKGLQSIEVPMTNAQVDRLIEILDKDGDGEVSISEFLSGDREYRRQQMHKKQKEIARLKKLRRERKLARLKAEEASKRETKQQSMPKDMLMKIHKMLLQRH